MPKNTFVDLNIIIDVLLERPGYEASLFALESAQRRGTSISGHFAGTFAYLLEHAKLPRLDILIQIQWLIDTFTIIPIDTGIMRAALSSALEDYEDALVEQAALSVACTTILTRNIKDFQLSAVPAVVPEGILEA